jgi:hypothetical protein
MNAIDIKVYSKLIQTRNRNEFGINIILVEPGVIKTNFENLKTAYTRARSESPYTDFMEMVMKGFRVLMDNNHSPPKLIAEANLEAITSKDPDVRYLVGDDAEEIMKVRKNASDNEFENWMYKRILRERQGGQPQQQHVFVQEGR